MHRLLIAIFFIFMLFLSMPAYAQDEEYDFPEVLESKEGEKAEKKDIEKSQRFQLTKPLWKSENQKLLNKKKLEEKENLRILEKNIEWFGVNLGFGFKMWEITASDSDSEGINVLPVFSAGLLFATVNYKRFYITILELHPVYALGYLGGGIRLGLRIPLHGSYKQELRVGSFLGADSVFWDFDFGFSITPHIQYIFNKENFSGGLGLDIPLNFKFNKYNMRVSDGRSYEGRPIVGGVMLYFRFTVGRTDLQSKR